MKTCANCRLEKELTEFNKDKNRKDGFYPYCKKCNYIKNKNREDKLIIKNNKITQNVIKITCSVCKIEKNSTEFYERRKGTNKYRSECIECIKKIRIKDRLENIEKYKEKDKKYFENNKDIIRERGLEYYKNNKDIIIEKATKYTVKKLENDIEYKIKFNLRSRIRMAIKNQYGNKSVKTLELLGCTIDECRQYLESLFLEGMSWENYGTHGWHIDHILPCSSFDLTDIEQQKKCFNYTNLQPLWAIDNIKKGCKINYQI